MFEFNDLLDELARVTGRSPRRKLHVPVGLMKAQTVVLKHFPPPLKVTREQIVMLLAGTQCDIVRHARRPGCRALVAGRGVHEVDEIQRRASFIRTLATIDSATTERRWSDLLDGSRRASGGARG